MIIPNIWENKKCSKPPTSASFVDLFEISHNDGHPTVSAPPLRIRCRLPQPSDPVDLVMEEPNQQHKEQHLQLLVIDIVIS